MTDELNDVESDTDDDEGTESNSTIRQLRQAHKDQAREAKAAKTKLAIYEAGVPGMTKDRVEFFAESYKGTLDADQITEAWTKIFGGEASPPASSGPETPQESPWSPEQTSTAERERLAAGVSPGSEGSDYVTDPHAQALAIGNKLMEEGGSRVDAMALALNATVQHAHNGNPHVLLNRAGQRNQ